MFTVYMLTMLLVSIIAQFKLFQMFYLREVPKLHVNAFDAISTPRAKIASSIRLAKLLFLFQNIPLHYAEAK